jgi:hypothetical protein
MDDGGDEEIEMGPVSEIVAGYANGSIRKWEVRQANCTIQIER